MTYDTREVSQSVKTPLPAAPYVPGSPIAAIVDYLYAWQRGLEK